MMAAVAAAVATASPAWADLRDDLAQVAFVTTDKKAAIAQVNDAIKAADGLLAAKPGDHEAMLQRGVALGYRAKLTKNRNDAIATRKIFEALVAANPRDSEAQMAIATWHLDAVDQLGGLLARTGLGARRPDGEVALDKSVALGNGRAFFPGLAALLRIRMGADQLPRARALAEAALAAPTPTPLDRLMKRDAGLILPLLKAGDAKAAAGLARKMLPFGRLGN